MHAHDRLYAGVTADMAYGASASEKSVEAKPLPKITPLNRPFWDYALKSIYALQTCDACGDAHVPEAPVCPRCLNDRQTWKPASGKGTLQSWADFHRAYWDGFEADLPYRTCLVRLDEGPLVVSNLVGGQANLRIGARVHVVFDLIADGIALPKFSLDEPGC
ncbi:OB-fold domain-containing protein [Mesorhizobium sp. M7A.F.Ca.MR.245.00.0.0]|uniref:Zn-ribbon domain-containing OB-fold protein n=1 Tax=Mesorhizobium sp. M7A.F.Ca.MR.245.00.0.0 TaxID=2496778 RepID=UPI0019D26DA0|nr:OB-fold domain-containing protein [Mesorhizobium sp. M7A.F.Ca.MR.245.00.0.0]